MSRQREDDGRRVAQLERDLQVAEMVADSTALERDDALADLHAVSDRLDKVVALVEDCERGLLTPADLLTETRRIAR